MCMLVAGPKEQLVQRMAVTTLHIAALCVQVELTSESNLFFLYVHELTAGPFTALQVWDRLHQHPPACAHGLYQQGVHKGEGCAGCVSSCRTLLPPRAWWWDGKGLDGVLACPCTPHPHPPPRPTCMSAQAHTHARAHTHTRTHTRTFCMTLAAATTGCPAADGGVPRLPHDAGAHAQPVHPGAACAPGRLHHDADGGGKAGLHTGAWVRRAARKRPSTQRAGGRLQPGSACAWRPEPSPWARTAARPPSLCMGCPLHACV